MPEFLSLLARWLSRGLPHGASSERVSSETATQPHDSPPPPPYEAASPMKGLSSRTFPSGIKKLNSPTHSTVDIVFVHGITDDCDATWTGQNSTEPWPKTLLPSIFPTARTLTFGYNAHVSGAQGKDLQQVIFKHGWDLLNSLSSFRNKDDIDEKPIIFVCHGLGGLICKHALFTSSTSLKKHSSIFRSTRGIAFFGTPLVLGTPPHEADLSSLAKLVTQSIGLIKQKDIIDVYRRGFESVLANNPTDFNKIHKARTDGGLLPIEIACFYEELSTEGYGFVVPQNSAVLPRCTSFGIDRNHLGMTKFTTMDDCGFIAVCEILEQWIKADLKARQYGKNICQYNMLSRGEQQITGGHFFEADGDMNFLEIPPLPANERNK